MIDTSTRANRRWVFGEFWYRVITFVFSGSYMCPFSADELHKKLTGGRVPL